MRKPGNFNYRLKKSNAGFVVYLLQFLANASTVLKISQHTPSSCTRPITVVIAWGNATPFQFFILHSYLILLLHHTVYLLVFVPIDTKRVSNFTVSIQTPFISLLRRLGDSATRPITNSLTSSPQLRAASANTTMRCCSRYSSTLIPQATITAGVTDSI